jgi:hypothetical protein
LNGRGPLVYDADDENITLAVDVYVVVVVGKDALVLLYTNVIL